MSENSTTLSELKLRHGVALQVTKKMVSKASVECLRGKSMI